MAVGYVFERQAAGITPHYLRGEFRAPHTADCTSGDRFGGRRPAGLRGTTVSVTVPSPAADRGKAETGENNKRGSVHDRSPSPLTPGKDGPNMSQNRVRRSGVLSRTVAWRPSATL